jgi:hypothetical protein
MIPSLPTNQHACHFRWLLAKHAQARIRPINSGPAELPIVSRNPPPGRSPRPIRAHVMATDATYRRGGMSQLNRASKSP